MNKQEIIEKLKRKDLSQPFGLLTNGERVILQQAGGRNCFQFAGSWSPKQISRGFSHDITYILKPDYEPEPEFEDCSVHPNSANGRLSVSRRAWDYALLISDICSEPDFMYFFYPYGDCGGQVTTYVPGEATQWVYQKKEVSARFRNE